MTESTRDSYFQQLIVTTVFQTNSQEIEHQQLRTCWRMSFLIKGCSVGV